MELRATLKEKKRIVIKVGTSTVTYAKTGNINLEKLEKFVRVLDKNVCPETKWVEGSNYVDVNFKIDERTGRIVMMGALDNLVKGAAGQAIQNMNLLFGFNESEGLELVPMFP